MDFVFQGPRGSTEKGRSLAVERDAVSRALRNQIQMRSGSLFASCFLRDRPGAAARSRPITDFQCPLGFRDVRFKLIEKSTAYEDRR